MKLKSHTRQLGAICAAAMALTGAAHATVSILAAGYTNDFSVNTVAGDWITSTSNIAGTDATFTTAAAVDTFVSTYNASGLATALGTSTTNPPSANVLARWNGSTTDTTLGLKLLQMRPLQGTAKAANVLLFKMQNNTGALIPNLIVSYDFANPGAGTEQVPGWNAYYSVNGSTAWIKIPAFSTATPGNLSASLNFGGAGWSAGALCHILWVDDNAAGTDADEASYTMDNFKVTVPVVGSISAVVSNASRGLGANTTDPADDTITFDVTINGNNLPVGTPGWTTTGAVPAPPVTGTYGSTITVPNVPLSVLPLTIGLADRMDPTITGNFTVNTATLPKYIAMNNIGAPTLVLLDPASAPQWAGNGGTMEIVQNNGGGTVLFAASTMPITFAAGAPKCVTLTMEVQDGSLTSNFETEDMLKVELVTDAGTQVLTGLLDKNNSGFINGYSDPADPNPRYDAFPLTDEFNRGGILLAGTFTNLWRLHGTIPASATTAHLVITGINNSGTEFYRVRDVVFTNCVDTDGDGAYDSEEAVSGTDRNNASSIFRLVSQSCTGGIYSLTVPTVTTRLYQMDTSTDLVVWIPQAAAVAGTGADMTFTTPCGTGRKFARITVQ